SQTTPTTKPAPSGNRTVDGPVVQTRFGPVEVELVLVGGRIADVKALEYPNEARRSQFISEQALPVLHDEVLQAQSANIDTVSGATYTSDAYGQSLQAALDKAGITQ
ncbi:MAG: FMN-binding protein, partial [Acidimicrobiia bacterium]|nr:FMN-binding protein [Acidimicrobiia bacterium]